MMTTDTKPLINSLFTIMLLAMFTAVSSLLGFLLVCFLCALLFCLSFSTSMEPEPPVSTESDKSDHEAQLKSDDSPRTFLFKVRSKKLY